MLRVPGPDSIHPRLLHELKDIVASPLANIFNVSLSSAAIPSQWRQANVSPTFKKGDKKLPENYRPGSLTSIPCKLLERILKDKIMEHLQTNRLLSPHQHGFRPARSCASQLLEVLDFLTMALDEGKSVDIIYLDFKKAFDSVPHARLLHKVEAYGITGNILGWIKAFLSDRSQQVLIEGVSSKCCKVKSGVPQGLVLGPLLFLLYINDLPDCVKTAVKMFADDLKLYGTSDTSESRKLLQDDLCNLEDLSTKWQLPFNVAKCKVLHFGPKNPHHTSRCLGET